ncbi:MAG: hypothetical protein ACR2PS_00940 [Pseudomonadales bacterium]
MARTLTLYSWIFIVFMSIGETVVLLTTDKYWPLSVDDYVGMAALAYCTVFVKVPARYVWMIVCWGSGSERVKTYGLENSEIAFR